MRRGREWYFLHVVTVTRSHTLCMFMRRALRHENIRVHCRPRSITAHALCMRSRRSGPSHWRTYPVERSRVVLLLPSTSTLNAKRKHSRSNAPTTKKQCNCLNCLAAVCAALEWVCSRCGLSTSQHCGRRGAATTTSSGGGGVPYSTTSPLPIPTRANTNNLCELLL